MSKYVTTCFWAGVFALAGYGADEPAPASEAEIAKLIARLGSEDFATREEASGRLARMPAAVPALREATENSDDPEVRARAATTLKSLAAFQVSERKATVTKLLDQFATDDSGTRDAVVKELASTHDVLPLLREVAEQPNDKAASTRAQAAIRAMGAARAKQLKRWNEEAAKKRDLGWLIESAVAWRESVSKEDRERLRDVGYEIRNRVRQHCDEVPFGEFPAIRMPKLDVGVAVGKTYPMPNQRAKVPSDVIAEHLIRGMGEGALAVSRDGGQVLGAGAGYGFFGGSISTNPATLISLNDCLLVINGDFKTGIHAHVKNALILCTGSVQIDFVANDSVIVAGGEIKIRKGAAIHSWLYPKEKAMGDWVKWYEGASDGMALEVQDKAVLVAKLDAERSFAKAGLQVGDRIMRVNGEGVSDLRSLNKLLCRARLAPDGTAELEIRRKGKVVMLIAKLAD